MTYRRVLQEVPINTLTSNSLNNNINNTNDLIKNNCIISSPIPQSISTSELPPANNTNILQSSTISFEKPSSLSNSNLSTKDANQDFLLCTESYLSPVSQDEDFQKYYQNFVYQNLNSQVSIDINHTIHSSTLISNLLNLENLNISQPTQPSSTPSSPSSFSLSPFSRSLSSSPIPSPVSLEYCWRRQAPDGTYDLQHFMREMVTCWMEKVCQEENCEEGTFYLSCVLLDKIVSNSNSMTTKHTLQKMASVCMLVASKFKQAQPIFPRTLAEYTDLSVLPQEICEAEILALELVDWDISQVLPHHYLTPLILLLLLIILPPLPQQLFTSIRQKCVQIADFAIKSLSLTCLRPSVIAASSLFISIHNHQNLLPPLPPHSSFSSLHDILFSNLNDFSRSSSNNFSSLSFKDNIKTVPPSSTSDLPSFISLPLSPNSSINSSFSTLFSPFSQPCIILPAHLPPTPRTSLESNDLNSQYETNNNNNENICSKNDDIKNFKKTKPQEEIKEEKEEKVDFEKFYFYLLKCLASLVNIDSGSLERSAALITSSINRDLNNFLLEDQLHQFPQEQQNQNKSNQNLPTPSPSALPPQLHPSPQSNHQSTKTQNQNNNQKDLLISNLEYYYEDDQENREEKHKKEYNLNKNNYSTYLNNNKFYNKTNSDHPYFKNENLITPKNSSLLNIDSNTPPFLTDVILN